MSNPTSPGPHQTSPTPRLSHQGVTIARDRTFDRDSARVSSSPRHRGGERDKMAHGGAFLAHVSGDAASLDARDRPCHIETARVWRKVLI